MKISFSQWVGRAGAMITIVAGFFFIAQPAHADPTGYTQMQVTISNGNEITFVTPDVPNEIVCPTVGGNALAARVYIGSYPDRTTLATDGGYISGTCFNQAWTWSTVSLTSPWPLEQNDSQPFPDGDYWFDVYSNLNPAFYYNFSISGGNIIPPVPPSTVPRIISFTPGNGSVVSSGSVLLSADIYNASSTLIRFSLQNFDTAFQYAPFDLDIIFSGDGTVSDTVSLSDGYYFGTISMLNDDGSVVDTEVTNFTVGQSSYGGLSFASTSPLASTTLATCTGTSTSGFFYPLINFGCFLVVPSPASIAQYSNLITLAKDRIPFVYFYNVSQVISSTTNATTSSFGTTVFTFGSPSSTFYGTTTVFDQSMLRHFIPDSVANIFRQVTTALLWLEFAWYVYRRAPSLFKSKE